MLMFLAFLFEERRDTAHIQYKIRATAKHFVPKSQKKKGSHSSEENVQRWAATKVFKKHTYNVPALFLSFGYHTQRSLYITCTIVRQVH